MEFIPLSIDGVWEIRPVRHGDARGYFSEVFRLDLFRAAVGPVEFVQDNESMSTYGVVRGLHFQRSPHAQAKLVRVTRGRVLDVAVDIRPSSPTFGQHIAVILDSEIGNQVFIPRGMAHGFSVLSEEAQFQYKVDNVYAPESEGSLRYDDAQLGIDWMIPPERRRLSQKDVIAPSWQSFVEGLK